MLLIPGGQVAAGSGTICNRRTVGVVVDKLPHSGASVWSAPARKAKNIHVIQWFMEHEYSGLNHHPINESFYSEHPKLNGPVKIFNHLHYLMGEYSIKTGIARWQRVIPTAQRDKLERWLGAHYPVPVAV